MKENKNFFSSNLCYLRNKYGYTYKDIADKSGLSINGIRFWEIGEREPNAASAYLIAKAFNISIDDFLKKDLRFETTKKLSINEFVIEVNKLLDKTDMDDKKKNMIRAILDNIKED